MPADSAVALDHPSAPATPLTPGAVPPPPELVPITRRQAFANKDVFLPAWFPACSSRELGKKPRAVAIGPEQIVLWRDDDGVAHAFESHCPHLGADLAMGRVVDGQLRCALHHWRFRGDGSCAHSTSSTPSSRCARVFPVIEQYGIVFVYPARTPAIPFPALPDGDDPRDFRTLLLPATKLRCHHHLTTANGLDAVHFEGLHELDALTPWHHTVDEATFSVHLHLHHRHRNPILRALLGDLRSRFSAHGPSIAWVTAFEPVRMHALFCTRPEPDGGSSSRAVIFLPRGHPIASLRVLGFLFSLLWQDGQMLDALRDFRPAYVDSDEPLRAYGELLQRWPRG